MAARSLSVTRHVSASPDAVYEAVSDLARMAAWSPEYVGSWRLWRGPPTEGVRFVGWNRQGWRVWPTTCRVVVADRPREFTFESGVLGLPVARWTYRIEPDGAGSRVEERWEDHRDAGRGGDVARWLGRVVTGTDVEARAARNEAGMRRTLERLAEDVRPAV
jgi:uncharacterized protein YndB with AHSA1/START domain